MVSSFCKIQHLRSNQVFYFNSLKLRVKIIMHANINQKYWMNIGFLLGKSISSLSSISTASALTVATGTVALTSRALAWFAAISAALALLTALSAALFGFLVCRLRIHLID